MSRELWWDSPERDAEGRPNGEAVDRRELDAAWADKGAEIADADAARKPVEFQTEPERDVEPECEA